MSSDFHVLVLPVAFFFAGIVAVSDVTDVILPLTHH